MSEQSITYSLEPFDPAGHRFRVVMTIPRPDPAGQVVSLPAWIPGSYLIRDFARHIEAIDARAGATRLAVTKSGNHSWRIAPCAGPLQITTVVYAWDLSVRGAHLDESHGFFNGTSVFLQPRGAERLPCRLTLLPAPPPLRWRGYTSL
ncbi:MAG: peptidase M61, partial [Burkholderiales bacterium]